MTTRFTDTALLQKIEGIPVLVVGDIMLDRFVYGDVGRISPEGPIPVFNFKRENIMLGGAGNVVSNLVGLGASARLISVCGADHDARRLESMLKGIGVDASGLIESCDRPTTVKIRYLAGGQHVLRVDYERVTPVVEGLERGVIDAAEAAIPQVKAVILSDYGKGVLTAEVVRAVIRAANRAGVPVLVDPKTDDFSIYKGADVVCPNRKELSQATAMKVDDDASVIAAGRALLKDSGIKAAVVTRSEDGMTILNDGPVVHLKTEAREVYDVSGAGDTVIATIAAALGAGAGLEPAARLANAAAGIVVGKVGTAPIRKEELLTALEREDQAHNIHNAAFLPLDAAVEQVERWKKQGLKVGFTNGCFDVLHSGHVGYLSQARARCDRLVVAINADSSVRRLKGPERPVNDEAARAAVIGALGCVDLVVLFGVEPEEDDKPLKVIRALTPDLLVKGADYTVATTIGADYVISTGGEVWLAPLEPGKSTTATLQKLKGSA